MSYNTKAELIADINAKVEDDGGSDSMTLTGSELNQILLGLASPTTTFEINKTVTSSVTPSSLTFKKISCDREIDFMPDKFNLVRYDFKNFYGQGLPFGFTSFQSGVFTVANSVLSITSADTGGDGGTVKLGKHPRFAWWAHEVELASFTGATNTTYRQILIGLFKDKDHHMSMYYDANAHTCGFIASNYPENGATIVSGAYTLPSSALPLKMRVACTGINLKGWVEYADGTTFETPTWDGLAASGLDFRNNTYYDGSYEFGVELYSDTICAVSFPRIKSGYFGYTAIRDFTIMNTDNGEPVIVDNKVYATATYAGFVSAANSIQNYFKSFSGGVITFDLATHKFETQSMICIKDSTNTYGTSLNAVYVRDTQQFLLLCPSWHLVHDDNGFGATLGVIWSDFDVRSGIHIFDNSQYLHTPPVADPAQMSYDGSMLRINGEWYVGFTYKAAATPQYGNFRLCKTTDFATWASIATVTPGDPVIEGFKALKIGGTQYFVGSGVNNIFFYNPTTGAQVTTLPQALVDTRNPANHAALFPFNQAGRTYIGWICFDGENYKSETFTYGNVYFYVSNQYQAGYESSIKKFVR